MTDSPGLGKSSLYLCIEMNVKLTSYLYIGMILG